MRAPALLLPLLLSACLGGPKGKPADPHAVCEKMEECDYRYQDVAECEDELLEDGKDRQVCQDRDAYLRCINPCLDDACSDFEICEYDCFDAWCP